ncbi:hypothetical protein CERSUDRAFT_107558 [Gelatoporia subvermispora B]|uniref:Uncharacterized protein n=1 Tax=Ceriporiopsis subvermispora (strain B) TaxID=914234 RepID=M2R650_CERS8|nr:hypothetical protein CERSUDRAFT_107558 [Gelatoporia subvermispora B]
MPPRMSSALFPRAPPLQSLHAHSLLDSGTSTSTSDRVPPDTPQPASILVSALQRRASSGLPEIDGSSAGFIALIVVLAAIIVLASVAAFLLARDKPLPRFRVPFRRASSSSTFSLDHARPRPDGMRGRLARLFGRRPDGWVRADADVWNADAEDDEDSALADAHALTRERSPPSSRAGVPTFVMAHGARVAPRLSSSISQDSVEAELAPAPHYAEPFAARYISSSPSLSPSPPPVPDSPSPTSPAGPLTPLDVRTHEAETAPGSPEPAEDGDEGHLVREDSRVFAVRARDGSVAGGGLRAMRKFENGTKFKEALDF